jgi:alkylation response protein AidB-like acyl-CoA dehydrogenase
MDASTVLAAAAQLHDLIAAGADEADRERRLPAGVANAMADAGLYRASVAAPAGGLELDPISTILLIEAVSRANGSAGWNLMIGLETAGISSGAMTEQAWEDTWRSHPAAKMSGALNPLGRARPVEGGFRVSGRWPFASGIHNADWFWAGCLLLDRDGELVRDTNGAPRPMQVILPKETFEILDTWHTAGLRGSGSHDVVITDAFVPAHRTTGVYQVLSRVDSPLFRYPLTSRLCYNKVGVATGIARAAIEAFVDLAGAKKPYLSQDLLRDRAHAQLAVAEAEAMLSAGRAYVLDVVGQIWAELCAGRSPSAGLRVRQRLAASWCVEWSVRAVELLHRSSGATANNEGHAIERAFRDVHVVAQHTTVNQAVFETAGRALLGMEVAPGSF